MMFTGLNTGGAPFLPEPVIILEPIIEPEAIVCGVPGLRWSCSVLSLKILCLLSYALGVFLPLAAAAAAAPVPIPYP